MSVQVIRAAKQITVLSGKTLAAGQAEIARHGQELVGRIAEEQGLRVVAAAQADLAQRSVERWIELLYQSDNGVWYNVREDGLIWLAPPWSRTRRKHYGLSEPQARLLLRYVRELLDALPDQRRLYYYLSDYQRYALNRHRFPTVQDALHWQQTVGAITPARWRAYQQKYPGGRL